MRKDETLFAIMLIAAAASQVAAASPPPTAVTAPAPISAGTASVPLRRDRKGRPVIAVDVNGKGPFDMVVDTGAQTSVIAPTLARELALPTLAGTVAVIGATGVTAAPVYGVDLMSTPLFRLRNTAVPALVNSGVTEARGIIGMHVATGRKLVFDRQAGTLSIAPSGPPPAGFVAIAGRLGQDGLLVVPVRIDGREVEALVDSGAEGVIAGPRLLDLLGWRIDDPRLKAAGTMRGAGGAAGAVRSAAMELRLGPVRLSNVPVIVTSAAVSSDGGRERIILGSNVLAQLDAYAVDFGSATLELRTTR